MIEPALAIAAVTTALIVAFVIGFIFGEEHGARQARIHAFNQCIDWAALALKGNPVWRSLTPHAALLKAGALIGGADVIDRRLLSPTTPPAINPLLTKGNQA